MANKRLTQEEVSNRISILYNDEYQLLSQYDGKRNDIILKHKCGYEMTRKAGFVFNGSLKCPICDTGTNLNTDLVKIKIKQKYGNEFELIGEYINSVTPIKIKHIKCGEINNVTYSNFIRSKIGCYKCSKKCLTLSQDDFDERLSKINNGNIIALEPYTSSCTIMKFKNLSTNHIFETTPDILYRMSFNNDYHNKVIKGENDINTTCTDISNMLVNKEDGYKYSYGTKTKLDFKCPNCGNIIHTAPSLLFNKITGKLVCQKCGDGFSYPEKFLINCFIQSHVNFIYQYSYKNAKWCKNYRYDFYLPDYNWIIETDGGQHYKYDYIKENDKDKENLALQNNITKYIHINASKSSLDYLKNSIINSELSSIIKLDINWSECGTYASKSLLIEVCNCWNGDYGSIKEMSEKYKVTTSTIISYLKKGNEYGLINYSHKDFLSYSKKISREKAALKTGKPVICIETNQIYKSIAEAQKNFSKNGRGITKAVLGYNKTAYGYHWAFV